MGQRLLVLGALGVVLTLTLVGTALMSLSDVTTVNRELARVNHALNQHKTAEELHDALRADVARAQLVGSGGLAVSANSVRRDARRHAAQFRRSLDATAAMDLPPTLKTALSRLRPVQKIYIATAEQMVEAALSPRGVTPGAHADYEAAFKFLVPEQRRMTRRLMATTAHVEAAAARQRIQAQHTITVAAVATLGVWLALAGWHHRSMRHLQAALVREADQRAAADLLQGSLLPLRLPQVPGARMAARSVPGNARHRVGGDWYDAFNLPTGELFLVIGDVVGHDLPAATVMGQLRNALRAYALEDSSPASVLARVNRAAYLLETSDLATCITVVIDPATMVGRWASAGHPPPLVASADGVRRFLSGEPGPPLGVTAPAEYPTHPVHLAPGDTLLLYSDGLVERRNVPIDVGLASLENIDIPDTEPEAMCDVLLEAMLDAGVHADDVTCLLLQVQAGCPDRVGGYPGTPARTPTSCA